MNNTHEDGQQRFRIRNFIFDYSVLLIAGAAIALVWANFSPHSYHAFIEFAIFSDGLIGEVHAEPDGESHRILTVHYFVNDVLMAFFFAVAAKEVWEAIILKDGSLRGRKALTPLIATAGGMVGPIAVYLGIALLLGSDTYNAVANGWAIPTATDIAFLLSCRAHNFRSRPPRSSILASSGYRGRRGRPADSGYILSKRRTRA